MTEHFRTYDFKGCLIIESLVDKLDFFEISDSMDLLKEFTENRAAGPVIFDLSRVAVVDSSAFGFLVETHNAVRQGGHECALVCSDRDVLHVMKMLRLRRIIPVFDSLDAAASHLVRKDVV